MSDNRLFGDAKATARVGDTARKQRVLDFARSKFETDPTPANQMELASALFDSGRYADAERLLSELREHNGDDIQLLCDLAFIYKNMDRLEEAKSAFLRIVELDPRHPLARCAENELWMIDPEYRPSWLRREQ